MTDITMAIDPAAAHDLWVREHEWHLNLVPAIIDAIVEATLPKLPVSRGGSRFDKDQITGGGYFDAIPIDQFDYTGGGFTYRGAAADARELWTELVEYLDAAVRVVEEPARPVPVVSSRPDADPLTAKGIALVTVGWLIDHGDQIAEAPVLTREPTDLFALIRRLRGRYGVFSGPRRQKPETCLVCGEPEVRSHWVNGTSGPRSVEVKRCRTCGDETRGPEPVERRVIAEINGHPIQARGGVSEADRAAFAAVLSVAKKDQSKGESR